MVVVVLRRRRRRRRWEPREFDDLVVCGCC
jgi:hypothetical protein